MPFILIFLFIVFFIVYVQNDVNITDSGVVPWKEGDFAITFYVTLFNSGNRPVVVVADMIECCEQISDTEACDHFKLIGNSIDLEARRTENVTLTYLNTYSYNRNGKCVIRINILFNSAWQVESTVFQPIYFDTTLKDKGKLSVFLQGYSRTKCEFQDEDPLDSCLPVNCHMKYSGFRGFYSTSENKCIEIPKCQSNNCSKQAYLWSSNQCVDLNNSVTENDIKEVLYMIDNNQSDECQTIDNISHNQKIRCHNGYLNNLTDLCECNPGWENEENLDYWDNFIPSTVPLNMCTIPINISEENVFKILKNILFVIPENWTIAELICSILISCAFILLSAYCIDLVIIPHDTKKSTSEYTFLQS